MKILDNTASTGTMATAWIGTLEVTEQSIPVLPVVVDRSEWGDLAGGPKQVQQQRARAIAAKLALPHAGFMLSRPRLRQRIAPARGGGLISLVAGPGYGKTSFIVDLLSSRDTRAVYLGLDEEDRDPLVFLAYLAAGLGLALEGDEGEQKSIWPALAPDEDLTVLELAAKLTETIQQQATRPTIVAIDDVHLVDSSEQLVRLIELLIRSAPPGWTYLLSSRRRIPLRISHLDLSGRVAELGPRELRFTPGEIRTWVKQSRGIDLGLDQARTLWRATEGWPAAVVLLGEQLARTDYAGIARDLGKLVGRNTTLRSYLEHSLLDDLDPYAAETLLVASLLSRVIFPRDEILFSGPPGRAEAICAEFAARGCLVSRRGYRAYSVHPLVREVAERRARQGGTSLLVNVGEHLEAVGELNRAVACYLQAGRYTDAGRVIRRLALSHPGSSFWASSEWPTLTPDPWEECCKQEPWLIVAEAKISQVNGRYEEAVRLFRKAATERVVVEDKQGLLGVLLGLAFGLFNQGLWEESRTVLDRCRALASSSAQKAEILLVEGAILVALCRWDEAIENWEKALILAPQESRSAFVVRVHHHRARLFYLLGEYPKAQQWAAKALGALGANSLGRAMALNAAAIIACFSGRYQDAAHLASECQRIVQTYAYDFLQPACLLTQGAVATAMGNSREGFAKMRQARSRAAAAGDAEVMLWADLMLGDFCRRNRSSARAMQYHQEALSLADERRMGNVEAANARTALGMDLAVAGREDEALAALEEAVALARKWGLLSTLVPALFYLGWLYARNLREQDAVRCLGECLRRAQEHDHVYFFHQEARVATPILALCERLRVGGFVRERIVPLLPRRLQDYFWDLATGRIYPTEVPLGGPQQPAVKLRGTSWSERGGREMHTEGDAALLAAMESLTEREHDILEMIALGLSNKVIAAKLYITEKTVKSHTNHIFRKLGVQNRLQATLVLQAWKRARVGSPRRGDGVGR